MPKPVFPESTHRHGWTTQQVLFWLETIKFAEYKTKFLAEGIAGFTLDILSKDDLKDLGMGTVNCRALFLHHVRLLKDLQG